MSSSVPIRLKIDMESDRRKSDSGSQWPEENRKHWIVAMFCGTLLLYATRSAVPLCLAAMSSDMNWDKEVDVSFTEVCIKNIFQQLIASSSPILMVSLS